tara:strand:- start:1254 stop:1664 length:411 start_codon:yes stop_codon:yes gene_type:complete
MKKFLFTIILACGFLVSSAQFTVVSTVDSPADGDSWGLSNFTNNIGVGYSINDNLIVGTNKNGDDYDVFARYTMKMGFVCLEAPTKEASDNMTIGYGINVKIYNNLYLSPMYLMPVKEDEAGLREGNFKMGLSYNL